MKQIIIIDTDNSELLFNNNRIEDINISMDNKIYVCYNNDDPGARELVPDSTTTVSMTFKLYDKEKMIEHTLARAKYDVMEEIVGIGKEKING